MFVHKLDFSCGIDFQVSKIYMEINVNTTCGAEMTNTRATKTSADF